MASSSDGDIHLALLLPNQRDGASNAILLYAFHKLHVINADALSPPRQFDIMLTLRNIAIFVLVVSFLTFVAFFGRLPGLRLDF